jgi:hypothetical protein
MTPWQALTPQQRDAIVIDAMAAKGAAQAAKLAELRRSIAARKKAQAKKGKRR